MHPASRFWLFLSLTAICSSANAAVSPQALTKLGPSLRGFLDDPTAQVPILVLMQQRADLAGADSLTTKEAKGRFVYDALRQTASRSQASLLDFLAKRQVPARSLFIINAVVIPQASPQLIDDIARRPDIGKIIRNPSLKLQMPEFGILTRPETGTEKPEGPNVVSIGADRVWNELKFRGEGIVVAGQDTGIEWQHPALKSHYRGWNGTEANHDYNWHDAVHAPAPGQPAGTNPCGYDTAAPCDDDKHGTHTMGTMVGSEGSTNRIGVAPGAQWMGCRNMDRGAGTPASYLECFQFFLAPFAHGADPFQDGDPSRAPHIINNSWGCPASEGCEGSEMIPALAALKSAGILVVASAGNDGPGCSTIQAQPAQVTDLTLSVGAHDHRTGTIASFSSRGPSKLDGGIGPDVTAPGVSVRSSVPGGKYESIFWSGTSMAGPHVVGQAALIWSAQPKLIGKIAETTELIRRTASAKTAPSETCGGVAGTAIPNNTYGYGAVDAYKSVQEALKY